MADHKILTFASAEAAINFLERRWPDVLRVAVAVKPEYVPPWTPPPPMLDPEWCDEAAIEKAKAGHEVAQRRRTRALLRGRERAERMYAMYIDEAKTLNEIGEAFGGMTRERVRQILEDWGWEQVPLQDRRRRYLRRIADEVATLDELEAKVGFSKEFVFKKLTPTQRARLKRPETYRLHYSNDELLALLRDAERHQSPLTGVGFEEWGRGKTFPDGRRYPTKQPYFHRWGTWVAACDAAGVAHNGHAGPGRTFSSEDCFNAINRCWTDTGKPPTVDGYREWHRDHRDAPSEPTIRSRVPGRSWILARAEVAKRRG